MNNISQEWIAHTILSWQGDHYTAAEIIWKNIQIELSRLQQIEKDYLKDLELNKKASKIRFGYDISY